jgi:hypothetical protein
MQQQPMNDMASGAVYVQTNAAPNEVIAFRRADDGSLDLIGSVETGGGGDGTPHLTSWESRRKCSRTRSRSGFIRSRSMIFAG